MRIILIGLLALLIAGCASVDRSLFPPRADEPDADIVVFSNHWHTGIIVPYADFPPSMRTQLSAFADYPYVAIGWGDTDFFSLGPYHPVDGGASDVLQPRYGVARPWLGRAAGGSV